MSEGTAASETPTAPLRDLPRLCAILGVCACVLSPIVLGLLPGALGVRTSIDAYRIGYRGWLLRCGMLLSSLGLACSLIAMIIWGGTLGTILLSREVERDAVVWRGRELADFSLQLSNGAAFDFSEFRAQDASKRLVLHFWSSAFEPCRAGVHNVILASEESPNIQLIGVAPEDAEASARQFLGPDASRMLSAFGAQRMPAPLDQAGVRPTTAIINADGKIELVLLGVRSVEELRTAFVGASPKP